jgi:signal transduction histidine kinase
MHRIPAHAAQGEVKKAQALKPSEELGAVLLDTLGLAETIEWHARRFHKCTGIPCELTVSNAAGFGLPEDYAAAIFDIYNDALRSVARHAGAKRVAISLIITPKEVAVMVRDNGAGALLDGATLAARLPIL